MKLQDVLDEIKLTLTGYLLEMEIDDKTLKLVVKKALRELERYWDETNLITIPFASCIDFTGVKDPNGNDIHVSSVVKVYRTQVAGDYNIQTALADPMFAQQWMIFSNGGTMYNLQDYILNYSSWNTLLQIKNTLSTDMAFKEDRHNNKLYINNYLDLPKMITIEYIPKLKKVGDIKSDYWIDILIKLCIALTKIVLGRIRTRYSVSNAPWGQDGEKLLEEGNSEYNGLMEKLSNASLLIYPID